MMTEILWDLILSGEVEVYIDDVLIHTMTQERNRELSASPRDVDTSMAHTQRRESDGRVRETCVGGRRRRGMRTKQR